jgi:hypothetical protein
MTSHGKKFFPPGEPWKLRPPTITAGTIDAGKSRLNPHLFQTLLPPVVLTDFG